MYWILILPIVVTFIYLVLIKPFLFWKNKGVKQLGLGTVWLENVRAIIRTRPVAETLRIMYDAFPNERYSGMYHFFGPVLYVRDPDLIKQIAVKDFDHFLDHHQTISEDVEPLLAKSLVALKGEPWKDMRATLSPSFTSSKMRSMFVLMVECAQQFVDYFDNGKSQTKTIEMKDAFTRYTNDVIASVAFGVSCNSLKEPNNEFYVMGKEITNFQSFWKNITFLVLFLAPKLAKMLGMRMFSEKVVTFFRRLVKENTESREKHGIIRPDMIHLLMEARKGRLKHEDNTNDILDTGFAVIEESSVGKDEKRQKRELSDDDITAQAFLFFFAGFETISNLLSFAAYELAVNPDIQSRLQDEIDATFKKCGGRLTYESLLKMKYLDMVVSETLRIWAGAPMTDRVCVKPYTIQPIKNNEKPILLNKGDVIWFPSFAIHRNPQFYPEPDRFDPERFSDENKSKIIPYSYIPFGAGPRSCIGNRFALLESKTVLFYLLHKFDIVVTDKTIIPVRLSPNQLGVSSADGFWFGLKPRKIAQ